MIRARGFTLIEVLVATLLLAAGLALGFATVRASGAAVQRGEVPWWAWGGLAAWTVALLALALVLYRRDEGRRFR